MRRVKSRYAACVLGAVSAMAISANASAETGLYGSLKLGGSILQDMNFSEASTANLSLDPNAGFSLSGGVGYRFGNAIRLEFDLGYGDNSLDGGFQQNVQAFVPCGELPGNPCLDPNVDGKAKSLSGFVTGSYDLPVAGAFKPYIGVGVGFIDVDLHVDTRAAMNAGTVSRFDIINGSDTVVGYRGTLGVAYDMGDVDLTLAYTYTFTDRMNIPGKGTLVTFDFDRRMRAHALMAGGSYNF
jgi:opacity protein-like surface antigen